MSEEMDEIVREFLIESGEGLDRMDHDLVELEQDPGSEDLLASVFRAIHTIKGTSGVLGFPRLESLAHVGENLLSQMRDGKLRLDPTITTVLLSMVDAIRAILAEIEATGQEGERDFTGVIESINALLQSRMAEPQRAGSQGHEAAVVGDVPNHQTDPHSDDLIGNLLVEAGVSRTAVDNALRQQDGGDSRRIGQILVEKNETKPETVLEALNKQGELRSSAVNGNIRVDVGLLDKVMNLVGELVLARNQVLQFTAHQKDSAFISTAQRLNLITTELQEGVMKTRMQPIGNVWSKFPRLVRDLAIGCGKNVKIELEGSDTELDKTIVEAIKDPLTHIVRNAVDHGIEPPEAREAAGKPSEGRLLLRAFHEGGQVNIEVSDDGAGIDTARLKQKALGKGIVPPEHLVRMSERELLNLIFLPGFSTAERVTNVSGRGVGMDVVKTNVERIGGTVDIHSSAGTGTTLKIKIPLTLAIIPALIVTSAGERFAIPQISLVELVRAENNSNNVIEWIQGAPVYRLRGNLLPIVFLNAELRLNTKERSQEAANIVVLQADGRQFGLVVDEINDTEEIVVKPLGKQLKGISSLAGATIMGDGRVALILDVLGIAQKANLIMESRRANVGEASDETIMRSSEKEQWLIFQAGTNSRMAVPLSTVARLEEISAGSVEKAGNCDVVQYRDQIMPLVRVTDLLDLPSGPPQDPLQVIVHSQGSRSVGLVVEEILDVVEESTAVKKSDGKPGLIGSAVIQQRVTDLLDPRFLKAAVVESNRMFDTSAGA